MKEHLVRERRNAKSCPKVAEDVRKEIMQSKKKTKEDMNIDDFEAEKFRR